MAGIGRRLADSLTAFVAVWRNGNLRWLELAWSASIVGHYAFLIAVSVYAYGVGGERAVGLIFLARLVPAAVIAPFAGMLGDRYRRERVLIATNVSRVALVSACAVAVFASSSEWVVYALSIAATIATTPFRSSQAALTPSLAREPAELTAANAVASGVESVAVFAGPALAGILLGVWSAGVVFALTAALLTISLLFLLLIRVERPQAPRREIEASTVASEALAGFGAIGGNAPLRVMMVLLTAQTAIAGAVQVFVVVMAIDVLDLGEGGVGYLNAAIGIGAFAGAVGALALVGARRLSPAFLLGFVVIGLPLVLVGTWPEEWVALVVLGLLGAGISLVDIAGLTLVQRAVPDDVLARVFGVIQMLWLASMGIGAALAPALIAWLGFDGALAATGASMLVLAGLLGRRVARIDARAEPPAPDEFRLLASIPIFAPLPGSSLEHLSARLVPVRLDAGSVVVREGDVGERFYIVAEGTVEISERGEKLSELSAGDYFGEIALLRDIPRTATVTAATPVVLYALDRDDFLATVTSHAPSAHAAEEVVSARLAGPAAAGTRSVTG